MREQDRPYWRAYIRARVKVEPATRCWLWQNYCDKDGYGCASAAYNDYGVDSRAHRLSFTAFKGPIPKGKLLRHKCHNPPCCNPAHLRVGTDKQNADDSWRAGRLPGPSRLTVKQVVKIRRLLAQGRHFQREIGALFGVTGSTISYINRNKTWRNL